MQNTQDAALSRKQLRAALAAARRERSRMARSLAAKAGREIRALFTAPNPRRRSC